MQVVCLLTAILLLFLAGPARADSPPEAAGEIAVCLNRNVPEPDAVRAVRISTQDRSGNERLTVVRVYTRRGSDGLRQVRVEFREPEEMRGSSVLLLERQGLNEIWLRTGPDEPIRRIKPASRNLPFLGTDFSYEDFEHLLAFQRPATVKRLADDSVQGRPVYVLETTPEPEAGSMYQRILTFVDQKTCVPLRVELYEQGGKGMRKKLVVDPMLLRKKGRMWLPQVALMEDMLNLTSTVLMVDSTDQGQPLAEDLFAVPASSQ